MDEYIKRLGRYVRFDLIEIPDIKATKAWHKEKVKEAEAEKILSKLPERSHMVLLDEKGKQFTSIEFSKKIASLLDRSVKEVCFVVAGSYGAHDRLKQRANQELSLSKMTFSHQIIRSLFLEQLYRAFTIIRGEPYHNEDWSAFDISYLQSIADTE